MGSEVAQRQLVTAREQMGLVTCDGLTSYCHRRWNSLVSCVIVPLHFHSQTPRTVSVGTFRGTAPPSECTSVQKHSGPARGTAPPSECTSVQKHSGPARGTAPRSECTSVQKRSGPARIVEGCHSFACHPHIYPQIELTIPVIAVPGKAGPRLSTPEGWEAELA